MSQNEETCESYVTIRQHIHDHPGTYFSELVRNVSYGRGNVQYHVRKLEEDDHVTSGVYYGKRHYYPTSCDGWQRAALAFAKRETTREVMRTLLAEETSSPADVAEAVGVARSTLEWHLGHLVEHDIVEKRYGAYNRVTVELCRTDRTADLLDRFFEERDETVAPAT